MLDKDQYNQDEYNDYYAQATADAEIKSSGEEGGDGGGKKIVIILLLLILIGALGYFGWTSMNSDSTSENEKSVETVETTTETTKEVTSEPTTSNSTSTEKQVAQQVAQNIVSERNATKEMAPEDIANIVQMVMSQLNQKNKQSEQTETTTNTKSNDQEKDSQLMESLSSAEVDSISSQTIDSSNISKDDNDKQASKSNEDNTYNKVVVRSDNSGIDELSKLSNEISDVIGSEDETDSKDATVSGYTQSITKEVETRQKEMRYIIVKKGDTLGTIAKRAYGNVMDYKKIYKANPDLLRRPDRIYIGQKLRVP